MWLNGGNKHSQGVALGCHGVAFQGKGENARPEASRDLETWLDVRL